MNDIRPNDSVRYRLVKAGEELQQLTELLYASVVPNKSLTMIERSEIAATIGRVGGIGIGVASIGRYELKEDT